MRTAATGEVHVEIGPRGVQTPDKDAIQQRAWRACDVGSAACGALRKDIKVELRPDGSGDADVQVLCSVDAEHCRINDAALQAGLDRL
jgi:hypothetical protein